MGKFPDFGCFRDIVLIEMKHLEADQKDRLNEAFQKHVNPDEHPMFYGTRPMNFAKLSNVEDIKACFTNALEEINARGLDMRDFDPRLLSAEELRMVYQDLPAELVALLTRSGR